MSQTLIDELNHRYGLLTVKKLTKDKNGRTAWLCECDCGNTKIVRGSDLRKGKITTCGYKCQLKHSNRFKDLTGQKFGLLTVISLLGKINPNNDKLYWYCKCDCGNELKCETERFHRAKVPSCGCYQQKQAQDRLIKNRIGEQYGYLTIVDKIIDENNHIKWKCQCKCGNIVYYTGGVITSKRGVYSCGCIKSHYEINIKNYLELNNINFKQEYSFPNLKSDKNRKLRFDFAILNKNNIPIGLIEFQGDQHFQPNNFMGGEAGFKRRQFLDNLKLEYVKQHNIPLLYLTKSQNLEIEINNFLQNIIKEV